MSKSGLSVLVLSNLLLVQRIALVLENIHHPLCHPILKSEEPWTGLGVKTKVLTYKFGEQFGNN